MDTADRAEPSDTDSSNTDSGNAESSEEAQAEMIGYRVDGPVATISLDSPATKNALSPVLVDRLAQLIEQANNDDSVRVVVLTNTGNTFCAGADLKAERPAFVPGGDVDAPRLRDFIDVFRLMLDGPKPVVGAIGGHATGGGVGLVAACDLSLMRSDALIGFTEVRIGVAPAIISVVCLPKMSAADSAELLLTGERVSPDRAAEVGLINRSVEPERLDEEVSLLIDRLLRGGPQAVAVTKQLLRRVPGRERDEAFAWTRELSERLFRSEEAAEGIAAFRERRSPDWVS